MKRFGTFEGVFTPCLLSILGVIMYLRLGWVVGSVGLGKTLLIIFISNVITLATAFSMASVVTNIRIGTGGAYSIITKSLGVEAGGAIGIPLYMSQAISVAFYITGFTECWRSVFPSHSGLMVSLSAWLLLMLISYLSAKLAFRIQYGILLIIGLSFMSILMSSYDGQFTLSFWEGGFKAKNFWMAFAVFFPAVTGILAGASMSGELKDPRKSIPLGTISAIVVSLFVYVFLAVWLANRVPSLELIENTSILIDVSRWRWLVVAGIMGATLSSALTMFVSSPRTLVALGKHGVVPAANTFVQVNKKGEPTSAILFTALLVLVPILFGTLDKVAELLTMIFLMTYGMINLTVFVEQTIGIASFRPSFRVPRFLSLIGTLGCLGVMLLINPWFSFIAILLILGIYLFFVQREVEVYSPDVRSGVLLFLSEQFAKMSARLPYHPKIWKPNLLIPVQKADHFHEMIPFVKDIVYPSGRTIFCKVLQGFTRDKVNDNGKGQEEAFQQRQEALSPEVLAPMKDADLFIDQVVVESSDVFGGLITVMQTVRKLAFPPNALLCVVDQDQKKDVLFEGLAQAAIREGLGVMILKANQQPSFGERAIINLWIRQQSPNVDLSILIALQLKKNWEGHLRILQVVDEGKEVAEAKGYLSKIKRLMRMPADVETDVLVGRFQEVLEQCPPSDINIFGMPNELNLGGVRKISEIVQTSVLFLRDSKHESALA